MIKDIIISIIIGITLTTSLLFFANYFFGYTYEDGIKDAELYKFSTGKNAYEITVIGKDSNYIYIKMKNIVPDGIHSNKLGLKIIK